MGEGTRIGVSGGSGRVGSACAGAAAQRAATRARERTRRRYPESAVRACGADGVEDPARHQAGSVGAGVQECTDLCGRNLREERVCGVPGALQRDDAGELLDLREVFPLRELGVQVGAEDQRPFGAGMVCVQPLEKIDRARVPGFLFGSRDAGARKQLRELLAKLDTVAVGAPARPIDYFGPPGGEPEVLSTRAISQSPA